MPRSPTSFLSLGWSSLLCLVAAPRGQVQPTLAPPPACVSLATAHSNQGSTLTLITALLAPKSKRTHLGRSRARAESCVVPTKVLAMGMGDGTTRVHECIGQGREVLQAERRSRRRGWDKFHCAAATGSGARGRLRVPGLAERRVVTDMYVGYLIPSSRFLVSKGAFRLSQKTPAGETNGGGVVGGRDVVKASLPQRPRRSRHQAPPRLRRPPLPRLRRSKTTTSPGTASVAAT